MRYLITTLFATVLMGSAAQAQEYVRCTADQTKRLDSILPVAHTLAIQSAARVGNTRVYKQWFGDYTPENGEIVRSNLKRLHKALVDQRLRFYCGRAEEPTCLDAYAYVYQTEAYAITVCPSFFTLPMMAGGSPDNADYAFGTMEGTIIHEMSHFEVIAGTNDACYGRFTCMSMARRAPADAIANADSYQYFAEDVGFALVEEAHSGE